MYVDLPEGHRTTLVAGLSDMLNRMVDYLEPDKREAFALLLQYEGTFESGNLRTELDRYFAEDPSDLTSAIASSFISMLVERRGQI
jgi:hypothetical protein